MGTFLEFLFGCRHKRYSWPFTQRKNGKFITYVSCLQCGKDMPYDFERMAPESGILPPRLTAPRLQIIDTPEKAVDFQKGHSA